MPKCTNNGAVIQIKIGNRPCRIGIPAPRANQRDEPQLISGEMYRVDSSNIRSPKELNYRKSSRDALMNAQSEFLARQFQANREVEAQERAMKKALKGYNFYIYKDNLYSFDPSDIHTPEQQLLLVKEHYLKQEKKFKKLQKEIQLFEKLEASDIPPSREPIPEDVRFFVWRRDGGKCVKCGGKENLEFDHIIPISKGGSSTERNIQLLCEQCNREKSAKI